MLASCRLATRRFDTTETAPVRKRNAGGARRVRWLIRVYSEVSPRDAWAAFRLDQPKVVLGREPGDGGIELDDPRASRRHAEIEIVPGSETVRVKDLESRNATLLDGHRIESDELEHGSVLRIGGTLLVYAEADLPDGLGPVEPEGGVSLLRAIAEASADLVAPSKLPVLIVGPTGAGKELLARRIHDNSKRSGALVAVNCSTFSKELIGSELFGHVEGAFSGATAGRRGLFGAAQDGTLFLDEIAELPLDQQPALLRALQEGKVRPVGSDREVPVDVRVIAATHQRLDRLHKEGSFRSDLYARLAGMVIELVPLASRREEILPLFSTFLTGRAATLKLSVDAAEALLLYEWPQNIRELRHTAERVSLFAKNAGSIELAALQEDVQRALESTEHAATAEAEPTKEQLEALLAEHEGNVAKVARAVGKHRQQLYRWLRRYDLDPSKFRRDV